MTCSGETEQVGAISFSLVEINSVGYFYPTQSEPAFVEAVELPFNKYRAYLGGTITKRVTHECTLSKECLYFDDVLIVNVLSGCKHRVGLILVIQYYTGKTRNICLATYSLFYQSRSHLYLPVQAHETIGI